MGQLKYPQKREIKGPWIISQEDFESLDKVVNRIDELLRQSWKNQIESEIYSENMNKTEEELKELINKREQRTYSNKHDVKFEFTSKDETKLSDSKLKGILKDNSLKTLSPKEFHLNIVHGNSYENSFDFRVSDLYRGELKYEIECFDTSIKDEIQYEIDKWIDKLKPNKFLQIWSNYGDFITFTFVVPLIILALIAFSTSYTSYEDSLRIQAHEIIKEGVNSTNRDSAIEVLLKSESGFVPKNFEKQEKPKNPIWMSLFIAGLFLYIVSIIRPKTTLGLGKMRQKLIFYKFWIKLVTVTLPSILILAPFWKTITSWLY